MVLNGHIILPMNIVARGPIYVNAKQFHGILRCRQARAKAERDNRSLKVRKPYLHELWHLHARHWAKGKQWPFCQHEEGGQQRRKQQQSCRISKLRSPAS
ncbi:hypothetical protein OPV22_016931 [Ensete ventricosum]|uniref:Nuclear transcription factor Y subunit n=1 Tax=Ensete ventricosum TaxID=4639 RepID=A0AAV8PHB3_ENSVE|nr:hypothetical protein OPV22_016931 [Ensete ventricosum]